MEPESSLPCSQHSATRPSLEPAHLSRRPHIIFKFHFTLIIPSMLMSSKFSIYFRCPTESQYAFNFSSIHEACWAHFILLDINNRIILDEECKYPSSSLRNFLQPSITSSFSDQNIFISTPLSKFPCLCRCYNLRPRFMPTQNKKEHLEHGRQ
jgi:hypothetical protein